LVFCILNREDREDRKEKMLAHLAAGQFDSVMDREEVARHIVDSAVAIHPAHRAQLLTYLNLSGRSIGFLNIFFAVFGIPG